MYFNEEGIEINQEIDTSLFDRKCINPAKITKEDLGAPVVAFPKLNDAKICMLGFGLPSLENPEHWTIIFF